MLSKIRCLLMVASVAVCATAKSQSAMMMEPHRPQIHFSPKEHWVNDPNGMVFYNNTYHLFYQYYPDSTVWGPMHWGHATSTDLAHWQHQPIALYPDSLGYIFSGSAVADLHNTSGLGKNGQVPLVAIFTHHDPKGEKAGRTDFQNQSIAYSTDNGKTWIKYAGNPVLKNPGVRDFRDPKVCWFEPGKKWIMTLAAQDQISFYSSKNLLSWTKESDFGKNLGAHGGVWECPDLFPMEYNGETVWVLIVNLNPGAPNGGSGTQYFTGRFDGNKFVPFQTDTRWADYGPDNYAGITWSNTSKRKIFIGWMSNWLYANQVPTEKWRNAMTIPRELSLEKMGEKYMLCSNPVKELSVIQEGLKTVRIPSAKIYQLSDKSGRLTGPLKVEITTENVQDFSLTLSNSLAEKIVIGYDKASNNYFIDRTQSGKVDFRQGFAGKFTAPRLSAKPQIALTIVIDNASVELFADNGLSVMTAIFFPNAPLSDISLQSDENARISSLKYARMKSILK